MLILNSAEASSDGSGTKVKTGVMSLASSAVWGSKPVPSGSDPSWRVILSLLLSLLQKPTRLPYWKPFDAARLPIPVPGKQSFSNESSSNEPSDTAGIQIHHPRRNLKIKFTPSLSERTHFVACMDSIGKVEGTHCLIE